MSFPGYDIGLEVYLVLTRRVVKKVRMNPSMYEDENAQNHHAVERLRSSKRLLSLTKSHPKSLFCRCCSSCSVNPHKAASHCMEEMEDRHKKSNSMTDVLRATGRKENALEDEFDENGISVGPLFQAEVPEWTGEIIASESKWQGTQMWPPKDEEQKAAVELNCVGKGRPDSCQCRCPGSIVCVRFHIAEKRMQLRHELGLLFYRWRFDKMGEEVSLSWTEDEELRFKNIVRINSDSRTRLWGKSARLFPTKSREKLVSYYFNVYLVQRRSYQNRVTPKNIDSDDEETEFGSIGGRFGSEAISVSDTTPMLCLENKQCTELP